MVDLDETLVHFFKNEKEAKFLIRPFAYDFIEKLSTYYELIIFTAAQQEYADWVLDKLDTKKLISYRLYWEHCQME